MSVQKEVLMDKVLRIHPETGLQRVGGRFMAATPDERLHSFIENTGEHSEVAERIVELCDGVRTVNQIVDALCEEFEVDWEMCAQDTQVFLEELVSKQILMIC